MQEECHKVKRLMAAVAAMLLGASLATCSTQPAPAPLVPSSVPAPAPVAATPEPVTPVPPPFTAPPHTEATVTRVVDGSNIEVQVKGRTSMVRYIGIDTLDPSDPVENIRTLAREAADANRGLVEGKHVRLVRDVSQADAQGRLLRYVYAGDLFINAELVRLGYAWVATQPPDVRHRELFLQLEQEARQSWWGMWAAPKPPPTPAPAPPAATPTPPSPPETATPPAPPPPPPPTTPTPPPAPTPPSPPSPPSPLLLQVLSVTSPVSPGQNATLAARTAPGTNCDIAVYYKSGRSSAKGLEKKTADNDGNVSWTWRVGTATAPGSWRIVVTATLGAQTVSETTYFTVG